MCTLTSGGVTFECGFEIGFPTAGAITPLGSATTCVDSSGTVTAPACAEGMAGCCTSPVSIGSGPPKWTEQCYYPPFIAEVAAGNMVSYEDELAQYEAACLESGTATQPAQWTMTPWYPAGQSSDAGADGGARDAAPDAAPDAPPTCGQ